MMLEKSNIDVRVKLILAFCISTLSVLLDGYIYLSVLLVISIFISRLMGGDILFVYKKLRKVLWIFFMMIFVQSIFIKTGQPLITVKSVCLVTDIGLRRAFEFVFRISIIVTSTTIILTSNSRQIIQGFVQLKLPYEIAFMVSIAIRFLPILSEELKDSLTAIELRGIDIKHLSIKNKIVLYKYLFTPIVLSSITKAKKLSISMECRGFRANEYRTSIINLKYKRNDYIIIYSSIIATVITIFIYYRG